MNAIVRSGRERLRSLGLPAIPESFVKSLVPITVLAAAGTAVVMMFLWNDQAGYKPVFGARERVAAAEMMAVLDTDKVPYRLHPESGQILVPEKMLGKVRMALAAKGVTAKLPAGLELMDRNDPLGVSQFVQDIRFRRGLEGELSQSIQALDAVESARVHLSIAKSTSFVVSDGTKSSASVVVALRPGRQLSTEQIAAIINLVAGSVSNLDPQRVSLVDQAGNLLSARVDLANGFDAMGGQEAARKYQEATVRSIRELLLPVLGEDNFRVSATADIDEDRIEETVEQYGNDPKTTSEAMRDEQDRASAAMGIPGSLSNRPVNSNQTSTGLPSPEDTSTAKKSATTRQYAYDRSIKQVKRARTRLARLNVSVVINQAAAPKGSPWTTENLAYFENILRSGAGIRAERGDTLKVSALAFAPRPAPVDWWMQRDNIIDLGTPIAQLLGALLAFFLLLRPLLKAAIKRLQGTLPVPAAPELTSLTPLSGSAQTDKNEAPQPEQRPALEPPPMPVVPLLEDYDLPPPGSAVDVMVAHLRALAAKEPERVAEVVKQWVQKNGQIE